MEDDVYKGYFIPAGTTALDNVWYAIRFCGLFSGNWLSIEKGDVPQ
jgi:hypothetical protein